jgi:large subunit ribosomal protein L13
MLAGGERSGRYERAGEMSTFVPSGKDISRKWYLVDASGQTLGRLATKAASVLSGKLNPQYVPYIDMGDHVIVINAEKVRLTGVKDQKKVYRRYTGFPGGLREESFTRLINRRPEKVLEEAIKGMLPKTKLGRAMGTKLKVYRGDKHPHEAQQPVALKIA